MSLGSDSSRPTELHLLNHRAMKCDARMGNNAAMCSSQSVDAQSLTAGLAEFRPLTGNGVVGGVGEGFLIG